MPRGYGDSHAEVEKKRRREERKAEREGKKWAARRRPRRGESKDGTTTDTHKELTVYTIYMGEAIGHKEREVERNIRRGRGRRG